MLEAKWLVGKRAGLGLNVGGRGVHGLGNSDLRVLQIVGHIGVSQEGVSEEGDILRVGVGQDSKSAGAIAGVEDQLLGGGGDGHSGKVEVDRHVSVTVNVDETGEGIGSGGDTELLSQSREGGRRDVGERGSRVKDGLTLTINLVAIRADAVVGNLQRALRQHGQNSQVSAVLGVVDTTQQQGTGRRASTVEVQRVDDSVNVSGILERYGEVGVLRIIRSQRLLCLERDTKDTGVSSSAAGTGKLEVRERNAAGSKGVGSPVSIGVSRHVLDEVVIADVGVGGGQGIVELTGAVTLAVATVISVGDVEHPQIRGTSVQKQVEVLDRSSQTNGNGVVGLHVVERNGDGTLSSVQVLVVLHKVGILVVLGDREGHDLGLAGSRSDKSKKRSEEGGGELHGCYSEVPLEVPSPLYVPNFTWHHTAFIHGIYTRHQHFCMSYIPLGVIAPVSSQLSSNDEAVAKSLAKGAKRYTKPTLSESSI